MSETIHLHLAPPFLPAALPTAKLVTMDSTHHYPHQARLDLLELLDKSDVPFNPKLILDVGCHTGATSEYLKIKFPDCTIVGIEPDPIAAQIAARHVDILLSLPIEQIDWDSLPMVNPQFDLILFPDVLEHLYNPWQVVAQLKQRLAPQGTVLASIPNIRHLSIFHALYAGLWPYADQGLLDATHTRFFTLQSARALFDDQDYCIRLLRFKFSQGYAPLYQNEADFADVETPYLTLRHQNKQQRYELSTIQFLIAATHAS